MLLIASGVHAGRLHHEREYQQVWCAQEGGVVEVRLDDAARVDCVTDDYAIEVDFASKWAESIGQALYYAEKTDKLPGVLLIMESAGDERYLARLTAVAEVYGIRVWLITPGGLPLPLSQAD